MSQRILATFVTTTSYGTWLPGDARGYIYRGELLPGNPGCVEHANSLMSGMPVYFDDAQQEVLWDSLRAAVREFGYVLSDVAIESWHIHWVVAHGFDGVDTMVGRLKNRMRQALNIGRTWTEGYCHRCLRTVEEILTTRRYIGGHDGCRMIDGKIVARRLRGEDR